MSDYVSLLDGPFAADWDALGLGKLSVSYNPTSTIASHRATTSSRTPGRVNVGTVYRTAVKPRELHLCPCGQSQQPCVSCGGWYCDAPGHQPHVCGSAW